MGQNMVLSSLVRRTLQKLLEGWQTPSNLLVINEGIGMRDLSRWLW